MYENQLPPEFRRKPEAQKRYYPNEIPSPTVRKFIPKVGQAINLAGQVWKIMEVKTRGRWKAAFKEDGPKFKPEVGMALNFGEPGVLQEIYQAGRRKFWAKPYHVAVRGGQN